jgi:hypothetical protein
VAQFINKVKVPNEGSVRHIIGFGQGDPGYDVLETNSKENGRSVSYYYIKNGVKCCVSISEDRDRYYVEHITYNDLDSFITRTKKSCSLQSVSRDFLTETVKVYRAYRLLFDKYKSFRDDVLDAVNSLECVYLGSMSKDMERLQNLLERSGFHMKSIDYDMIKTKEGICISLDGLCFNEDEIIP